MKDENKEKKSNKLGIDVPTSAGSRYKLNDAIKKCPLYKMSDHDNKARDFIESNLKKSSISRVVPGQLVMFNYFEPKTKEELEYYDAMPCTIFFGVFNSSQGKRILGFNIHYYPMKMRQKLMSRIFEIYNPIYSKYFTEPLKSEIDGFDYKYLLDALKKAKLDFGVREYVPSLCGSAYYIPANMWHVAVFTEGHFKKDTVNNIIKYWKEWGKKKAKSKKNTERKIGGDTKKTSWTKNAKDKLKNLFKRR